MNNIENLPKFALRKTPKKIELTLYSDDFENFKKFISYLNSTVTVTGEYTEEDTFSTILGYFFEKNGINPNEIKTRKPKTKKIK